MGIKRVMSDGTIVDRVENVRGIVKSKRGANQEGNDAIAWSNPSARIVKEFSGYIPDKIQDIMTSANSVLKGEEFSFFVKCNIDYEEQFIEVTEDWFYPTQVVTPASVEYKEDNSEYNGVIHKHPGSLKTFSSTDDNYINQNFQVSILWVVADGFCNGRINIPTPAGRIQLPVRFVTQKDIEYLDDVVSVVTEKTKKYVYTAPAKVIGTGATYTSSPNFNYNEHYGRSAGYGSARNSSVDNRETHEANRDNPPRIHEQSDDKDLEELKAAILGGGEELGHDYYPDFPPMGSAAWNALWD